MLKLARFLAPHRRQLALVLIPALAQSLANLLLPRLTSDIVDQGIVKGDQFHILEIGALMLFISLVATAGAVAGSYVSAKVSTGFGRDLRSALFARRFSRIF